MDTKDKDRVASLVDALSEEGIDIERTDALIDREVPLIAKEAREGDMEQQVLEMAIRSILDGYLGRKPLAREIGMTEELKKGTLDSILRLLDVS
ncbi:MAG: hypothetical protein H0T73_14635 [Ardenticatenales bacterium]|nr:hypothetical protein [Ardenticatenales bacterium]